jgi:uncharacterized metal-binding protein
MTREEIEMPAESEGREQSPDCARCPAPVCYSPAFMKGPPNCPTRTKAGVIEKATARYSDPKVAEFARVASIVEGTAYARVPWAPGTPSPATTRLEEIIGFAKRMDYQKLGVAYCVGFREEAEVLVPLLERRGFEVVSVCCKTGGIPKEEIGVKDEEKIIPGRYESMCNPISQAEILNEEGCDFNIAMGLCVGHDSLFLKHANAPTTVFAVKDRLLGHNPLVALYQSRQYYRRLRQVGGIPGEAGQ